jgi:hypothetical protein
MGRCAMGLGALCAAAVLISTCPVALSAESHCGELKPLAQKVSQENELVQEEHTRGGDPNWCRHARALLDSLTRMIEVQDTDPNHCRVLGDKREALEKSTHRVAQLAEGCP